MAVWRTAGFGGHPAIAVVSSLFWQVSHRRLSGRSTVLIEPHESRRTFSRTNSGCFARRFRRPGRRSTIVAAKVELELVLINADALLGAIDHVAEMQDLEIGLAKRKPCIGIKQRA